MLKLIETKLNSKNLDTINYLWNQDLNESFFTFFDQVNVQDPTMLFGKSGGGGMGGSGVNGPWAGG